jgi:hypothetical protein
VTDHGADVVEEPVDRRGGRVGEQDGSHR